MSVIVAVRDGRRTWLGSDTATYRTDTTLLDTGPKWHLHGDWALGHTGYSRTANILARHAADVLKPEDPFEVCVAIFELLKKYDFHFEPPSDGGPKKFSAGMLLARGDGLWYVGNDFSLMPSPQFAVDGYADTVAFGATVALLKMRVSPKNVVEHVLDLMREYTPYARGNPWIGCIGG